MVALDNFDAHRDYWHKVWEGQFGEGLRRVDLRSSYYLVLAPQNTSNTRLDSRLSAREEDGVLRGRVKAGLELSPYALNHLLTRLSPSTEPWSEAELTALTGADFEERLSQGAQAQCRLRGRRGERGALWVYPEFRLQTVVLTEAHAVDENGNVTSLAEKRLPFPIPALLHFVGVKSV